MDDHGNNCSESEGDVHNQPNPSERNQPQIFFNARYECCALTERGDYGGMVMPDVITLYRLSLCAFVRDEQELVDEVTVTVVHEVAHHFGIDDDKLHEWGWG